MRKRLLISLSLVFTLVMVCVVAPVAASGLLIASDATVTTPHGATSPVITVTEKDIDPGGTITMDVYNLKWFFVSNTITDANIVITTDASPATNWSGVVSGDTLTLTSSGGTTLIGNTITVTFKGTAENPWIAYTEIPQEVYLTVNRIGYEPEYYEPEYFSIWFDMVPPVSTGMSIADVAPITTTTGSTSAVITITAPIAENGNIIVFVPFLSQITARGYFMDDNVIVNDTAVNATWTSTVTSGRIILTSIGGPTDIGETVNVTFTGALNPWTVSCPYTEYRYITATRSDNLGAGYFTLPISTQDPTDLIIGEGAKINTMNGATSAVINITGSYIAPEGTILIDVYGLNEYVANDTLSNDNVMISDSAAAATWTRTVTGDKVILTSTGGPTYAGETVNLTFTGAVNPWFGNTNDEKTVTLYPTRSDLAGAGSFNFVINTTPPRGYTLETGFSATPREGIPPLSVSFTDMSKGHPIEWFWDFGDETTSTDKRPRHIYSEPGLYNVALTVWNEYDMAMTTKTGYINVINGAIVETDTQFSGLTVTNCGGPQTIMVNTSILTAALSAGNSVLEIQAPAESGFKTITFYAQNGGFNQNGDIITGNPTGVHLVSAEIAPTSGFSDTVGKASSFTYSIDLPSYPCNAQLSTTIWEGAVPKYDALLWRVASENNASPVGTAYTAEIKKTNFPSNAHVKLTMSVDRGWWPSTYGERVFIWRIADDEKSGQIFNTREYSDPGNNLDYYDADSPGGLSTFGLSSFDGSNNPFQIIAFIGSNIISQGINAQSGTGSGSTNTITSEPGSPNSEIQGGGLVVPAPEAPTKPAPLSQPAMSTNVGMVGWLLAIIQDYPIILVGVAGVIAVAAYFGWWKRRL